MIFKHQVLNKLQRTIPEQAGELRAITCYIQEMLDYGIIPLTCIAIILLDETQTL